MLLGEVLAGAILNPARGDSSNSSNQFGSLAHHVHAADSFQNVCSVKVQPGGVSIPGTAASFSSNPGTALAQHSMGLVSLNMPGHFTPFGQARSQSLQLNAESKNMLSVACPNGKCFAWPDCSTLELPVSDTCHEALLTMCIACMQFQWWH